VEFSNSWKKRSIGSLAIVSILIEIKGESQACRVLKATAGEIEMFHSQEPRPANHDQFFYCPSRNEKYGVTEASKFSTIVIR
jgi:hypothetical protein